MSNAKAYLLPTCIAMFVLAWPSVVAAQTSIAVVNAGFETPVLNDTFFTRPCNVGQPNGVQTADPIPGWAIVPLADAGVWNPPTSAYPAQAPEGQNVAYITSGFCGMQPPTVRQVLTAVLQQGTTYILRVEVGNRLDVPFPGYSVQLKAGGVVLAQDSALTPAAGSFLTSTVTYTALASDPSLGQPLEISLLSNGPQTNFDDVRLTRCTLATYCTSGISASGCQAMTSASGAPSASATSGFALSATNVEGDRNGIFFFGTNGRQANPWGNGTSLQCVVPPVKRAGLLPSTGTSGLCDGAFSQDLNALWCPSCPKFNRNPGAGAIVQAQLFYRDPFNTSNVTTSLSDAIEFCVGP